jgi:mannose-6-phosphate isomerase-like protein (cupin superfamily)
MKNVILGVLVGIFATTVWQTAIFSQAAPPLQFGQKGAAPQIAFDISKTDVDTLLKNAPPAVDQQLRVVDMGKYNLGVGIIHRVATNDKPGDPISGPYHDYTAEVYIIQSGGGILTTGPMAEKKPSTNYNILNGPGGSGAPGQGAVSRRVGPGAIIIIPPGVLHAWSQISPQVTYLSVRPDPDRVLPGGYLNPLLVKNALTSAK